MVYEEHIVGTHEITLSNSSNPGEFVMFAITPTITESRSADYVNQGLPSSTAVTVYRVTQNRSWTINARFLSRTILEGKDNYKSLNLLRAWMLPEDNATFLIGKPPILKFTGYKEQFYSIPVVMSDLSISFPEDVDYIEEAGNQAMMPIIHEVTISLIEAHGLGYRGGDSVSTGGDFDLAQFKAGTLPGY